MVIPHTHLQPMAHPCTPHHSSHAAHSSPMLTHDLHSHRTSFTCTPRPPQHHHTVHMVVSQLPYSPRLTHGHNMTISQLSCSQHFFHTSIPSIGSPYLSCSTHMPPMFSSYAAHVVTTQHTYILILKSIF